MYNITRYMWKKGQKVNNQRKLAKSIGMHECYLSRILNRHQTCPTRTAMVIANALDGCISDFFELVS